MILDLIGEENLPNVYFDSIEIDAVNHAGKTRQDMGAHLKVSLKVYDGLNHLGIPYFSDFKRNPKKTILLVLSKDPKFTQVLTEQGGVLNPRKLRSLPGYDRSKVEYQVLSSRRVKLSKEEETEIYYNVKFKLGSKEDHAALFACIYKEMRDDYTNGPVTSELVLIEGKTVKKAFYFVERGTSRIWNGPVHKHPSRGFMGGSYHTSEQHPLLDRISTSNLKIKDKRVQSSQLSLPTKEYNKDKKDLTNYHFGELVHSQSENGGFNFIFDINKFQIMKDHSLNKKMSMINEDLFYNLSMRSRIKDFSIFYNTKTDRQFKRISKTMEVNGLLKTIYTDVRGNETRMLSNRDDKVGKIEAIVEELVLNRENELRTFNCQINKKQIYQIKVAIEFDDPTTNYLKSLQREIEKSKANLTKYHALLKKPMNYDKDRMKTSTMFRENYSRRIELWYSPIKTFEKIININAKIPQQEKQELLSNIFNMLNPRAVTPDSCEKVINFYSKEAERFLKLYSIRKNDKFGKGRTNAKPNLDKNTVQVKKVYKVNFKTNPRTLDMFPTTDVDKQIPLVRVSSLIQLLTAEAERYEVNTSEFENIRNLDRDVLYLGPRAINFKNNRYDTEQLKNIDEEKIKTIVEESNKKLDFNLGFSRLLVQRYVEDKAETIDPVKQLGEDSPFQTNLDVKDKVKERQRTSSNAPKLTSVSKSRTMGYNKNKKLFAKNKDGNIFSSKGSTQIQRIPVHLKDLTYKDEVYGVDKNEFLKNQPNKKSLMYENIYKLEILSEAKEDKRNRVMMNSRNPIERSLAQLRRLDKPTYCILSKYIENDVVVEDNEFNRFAAVNTCVLIIPDNWDFTREELQEYNGSNTLAVLYDQMINTIDLEESFIRTSLVIQSEDREPIKIVKRVRSSRRPLISKPKTGRVEKIRNKQQMEQKKEQEIKIKEANKIKPKEEPKKPTRKQIKDSRKQREKAKQPLNNRTETQSTRTPVRRTNTSRQQPSQDTRQPTRRTNRTGRRRGY